MKIQTHQFGELDFEENLILDFPSGLFGFEQLKKFVLIKIEEELFYWLNSVEQPEIAFPLFGISVVDENYPTEKNGEAFGIVTLNRDPMQITINLKAPVYINQIEKLGFQKIIDKENYPVNYHLFVE
ncbi:MAG: flagellar assembly protein FliW [Ignavibacteria bacterium]|nr:flagellar assembly protein FliW [Ignavibacteria bacterium]MDP3682300.1 flagellar assembly protein FliW [Ignavibacteria bacterium]